MGGFESELGFGSEFGGIWVKKREKLAASKGEFQVDPLFLPNLVLPVILDPH